MNREPHTSIPGVHNKLGHLASVRIGDSAPSDLDLGGIADLLGADDDLEGAAWDWAVEFLNVD